MVTAEDAQDPMVWSGVPYFMGRALAKYCGDVTYLGPVHSAALLAGRVRAKLTRLIVKKTYDSFHSSWVARDYARIFRRRLERAHFDVVFAPLASAEIALLDVAVPIVYYSDATFNVLKDYYPGLSSLLSVSLRDGQFVERSAIERAWRIVYPSRWAAESAVRDYAADPARIRIIPLGANLEHPPSAQAATARGTSDRCRLLFVGRDWARKGGAIAVETLRHLRSMGVEAKLKVCGCTPPAGAEDDGLVVIPALDKNDPTQCEQLAELYLNSDFLILPTRADCFGVVFCEASAFGLPVISTNTGGVSDAVCEGETGFLLPLEARGRDYAVLIARIWRDEAAYMRLVRSSRAAFDQRLNWDAWGSRMKALLGELLPDGRRMSDAF